MEKLITKILLEVIGDIITEYQDTNNFIQQTLSRNCDREEISIDKVILFNKSRSKPKRYISKSAYPISKFKSVICLTKMLKGA